MTALDEERLGSGTEALDAPVGPLPRRLATAPPVSQDLSDWSESDLELLRAKRVATYRFEREDLDWLCRGFSAFLAGGGKLPLARCLHLPTNEYTLRRARRDHWLRRAWMLLEGAVSSWQRSEMLAAEVRRFQFAKWSRWCSLDHPPPGTGGLEEALYEAFRSHDRIPETVMQLHNIAGPCRDR